MKSCCEAKSGELEKLRSSQGKILKIVLVINAAMFAVEMSAGWMAHSTSLMADSLDMFGDAVVYAFSLYVLDRGMRWKARAGLLKGVIMAVFGIGVLAEAGSKVFFDRMPEASTMGMIGLIALAANSTCLFLLYRHRADDINMRSTWLCSRNDIVANVSVIGASVLVAIFNSRTPDVVVGVAIAALFLRSAYSVIQESLGELEIHEAIIETQTPLKASSEK